MEAALRPYIALLEHLNLPLIITGDSLTVHWMNEVTAKQLAGFFTSGHNIYDSFPGQKNTFFHAASHATPEQPETFVIKLPPFVWDFSAKLVSGAEHFCLWTIRRSVVQIDIPVPEVQVDTAAALESSRANREDIFYIFNAIVMSRTPENAKVLDLAVKRCYSLYRNTINREVLSSGYDDVREYDFEPVSMASYLYRIIEELRHYSRYPAGKLHLDISDKDIYVRIDPQKFNIAFFNILSNAYQASVPEGEITVSLSKNQTDCVVSVSDVGVGIDKKNIGRVFDPYFSKSPDEEYAGHQLGLGLSAAKAIAEKHSGSIMISGEPNHGTTVVLRIPLAEPGCGPMLVEEPKAKLINKLSEFYVFLADPCHLDIFGDQQAD